MLVAAACALVVLGAAVHAVAPDRVAQGYAQLSAWVPVDLGRDGEAASRSVDRTASPTPGVSLDGAAASASTGTDEAPAAAPITTSPAAQESAADPLDEAGTDASTEPPPAAAQGGSTPTAQDAASSAPAAGAQQAASLTDQVIALTNAERAAAGLPALATSACGAEQAQGRTDLLVAEGRFEHDPLGPIMQACKASTVGENLALGYPDAASMVAGWMASQGHRENILRDGYTAIGVACTTGSQGLLCAQVFLG